MNNSRRFFKGHAIIRIKTDADSAPYSPRYKHQNQAMSMNDPWKKDTNDKYVDLVKTVMGLSTASLFLPVLLTREFLGIKEKVALRDVFTPSVYWSMGLLAFAILCDIIFLYLSAKWIRTAWGKPAGILFSDDTKESTIEIWMEISFWISVLAFAAGLMFQLCFFVAYRSLPPIEC